jgi:hypothetical protein
MFLVFSAPTCMGTTPEPSTNLGKKEILYLKPLRIVETDKHNKLIKHL